MGAAGGGGNNGGGGGGRNRNGGGGGSAGLLGMTSTAVGSFVKVTVVVCPTRIVAVAVLPVSVPPLTLVSTKPAGTCSVIGTLPGATVIPAVQTGPSCPAGTVMLGMVGPPGGVVNGNVLAVVLSGFRPGFSAAGPVNTIVLHTTSVPLPGGAVAVGVAVRGTAVVVGDGVGVLLGGAVLVAVVVLVG
jgi:hypothetical protein